MGQIGLAALNTVTLLQPTFIQSASLLAGKTVADALFGKDVAGLGGIGFDFTAEAGHGDAEVLGFFDVVLTPDLFEHEGMSQDAAGIADESCKQSVFDAGEMDFFAADEDAAGGEVGLEVKDFERGAFGASRDAGGVAKGNLNASEELAAAEGFCQV